MCEYEKVRVLACEVKVCEEIVMFSLFSKMMLIQEWIFMLVLVESWTVRFCTLSSLKLLVTWWSSGQNCTVYSTINKNMFTCVLIDMRNTIMVWWARAGYIWDSEPSYDWTNNWRWCIVEIISYSKHHHNLIASVGASHNIQAGPCRRFSMHVTYVMLLLAVAWIIC